MGRTSNSRRELRSAQPKRSKDELLELLGESVDFLRSSSGAFDSGKDHEAKRLAVTLRVLLHQTDRSHSLLDQLGIKDRFDWHNTADPLKPSNQAPTIPGLVHMKIVVGTGGTYEAPLRNRPPHLLERRSAFAGWWNDPVSRFPGSTWCRKDYVLTLSNKEGGAHVDPALTAMYDAIINKNLFGWAYGQDGISRPFEGNAVTATVRQITYEVLSTLDEQLASRVPA